MVSGNSNITNCINRLSIDCDGNSNVGGIAGRAYATLGSSIRIMGCKNEGRVVGGSDTGDLVGYYNAYPGSSVRIDSIILEPER